MKGFDDSKACRVQDRSRSEHGNDQMFGNAQPKPKKTRFSFECRKGICFASTKQQDWLKKLAPYLLSNQR